MNKLLKLILLFCAITISVAVFAQSAPNSAGIFDEEINDVPINGAIALLTMAGIGIGIKKLHKKKH